MARRCRCRGCAVASPSRKDAGFGEGNYDESERAIRALLEETGDAAAKPKNVVTPGQQATPETYLGSARQSRTFDLTLKPGAGLSGFAFTFG